MENKVDDYLMRLQKRRKELKLTYDDLAEKSGVPRTSITNLFCGYVKNPRIDTIKKIATVLNMPLLDEELQGVSNFEMTPDKEELLMLYEEIGGKLGAEAQRSFLSYAKFLVDGK